MSTSSVVHSKDIYLCIILMLVIHFAFSFCAKISLLATNAAPPPLLTHNSLWYVAALCNLAWKEHLPISQWSYAPPSLPEKELPDFLCSKTVEYCNNIGLQIGCKEMKRYLLHINASMMGDIGPCYYHYYYYCMLTLWW